MSALHWTAGYVGTPWKSLGRDRTGCDCYGLARLVYAEQLQIDLPSYLDAYVSSLERREVAALIAGARGLEGFVAVERPREYDLVLWGSGIYGHHIGIVADRRHMLHVLEGGSAVVERLDAPARPMRHLGWYRHKAMEARFKGASHAP